LERSCYWPVQECNIVEFQTGVVTNVNMCVGLSKCLLVAINVTFFVAGAFLAVIGGLAKFNQDLLLKLFDIIPGDVVDDISKGWDLPAFLDAAGLIILIVGICLFIIGFCGCCGGLNENKCLLIIYMCIVLLIFAGQVAAIVMVYVNADEVEEAIIRALTNSIDNDYTNNKGGLDFDESGNLKLATEPAKLAWDTTQVLMDCCGVTNYTDYSGFSGNYTAPLDVQEAVVPLSCCNYVDKDTYNVLRDNEGTSDPKDVTQGKQCLESAASEYTRTTGCYTALIENLDTYQLIVAAVLGGILLVELIGFFSACCIIKGKNDVDK